MEIADSESARVLKIYLDNQVRIAVQTGQSNRVYTSYAWQIPRMQWTHVSMQVKDISPLHHIDLVLETLKCARFCFIGGIFFPLVAKVDRFPSESLKKFSISNY